MAVPPALDPTTYPDDRGHHWPTWREDTPCLFENREVRILCMGNEPLDPAAEGHVPALLADFDPQPDDPDPDIWPFRGFDPGYGSDDNLYCYVHDFPAPNVRWVTETYLDLAQRRRPPEVKDELLRWRSDDVWGEPLDTYLSFPRRIQDDDQMTALERMITLWNGETVRGRHLLADKCPNWKELFRDLDDESLRQLYVPGHVPPAVHRAFHDHEWYEPGDDPLFQPVHVLRKKVWYAPTQSAITYLGDDPRFASLRGDPREGLPHRVGVGLAALYLSAFYPSVNTYYERDRYVLDLVAGGRETNPQRGAVVEVITGHNNMELHRRTYKKFALFDDRVDSIAVFDTRDTAYRVMNHWHRSGLAELPHGPFDSNPRIGWAQRKVKEAYSDPDLDWEVNWFMTFDWLWRHTLGSKGPDLSRDDALALDW